MIVPVHVKAAVQMVASNFLINEINKKFGAVTRARECYLYTKKGQRLLDLWQLGGRAILGWGNSKPQFLTAARTRSRDSFTEASGRPTTSKCGRPPLRSHWHSTGCPWMPTIPQEWILATMRFPSAHRLVRRLRRRFFI